MKRILITGATGNVGKEVINALSGIEHNFEIYAGLRVLSDDTSKLDLPNIHFLRFDFTDVASFEEALEGCDILFLLRPPQISEVEKYFEPLIKVCVNKGVEHIVFLSVQGVEKSSIIPHHKIEKLIVQSGIAYTFLRPAYFMQNFTTTLLQDLVKNNQIYLPAGDAKFTLIDVSDIGKVAATVLTEVELHKNKSYELTCKEKLSFSEMATILSDGLGREITFQSPNLIAFFLRKRKEKIPTMLILVMIMLHYLPRFQKEPNITDCVEQIIHQKPKTFKQFVLENKGVMVG